MPLLTIFLVLIVVGVILWLINTYIPMDRKIKNILNVVAVVVLIIWLLQVFGLLSYLKSLRV
ncbi:MAG: Thivi_2564 family membrane protein [Bacteroidota bacterium]